MSGIAGVWKLDGGPANPEAFEPVLRALAGRGPDRLRAVHASGASLGQALLATTLEAREEIQPWVHAATGAVVVTDSRLDNREGLLASLGLRDRPGEAVGDAELIFEAVTRWGDEAAARLLGDFTFAVWEPSSRRLLLGRDSFGVRPLFYHFQPGKLFAFASSAEALLALGEVPRILDEGRLADALVGDLEGVDSTCTFFTSLRRLAPAHTLRVDERGLRLARYWEPFRFQPRFLPTSEAGWIESLDAVLGEAVRDRMRGLGPVGIQLSGGLDSTAVALHASRAAQLAGGREVSALSALRDDNDCPESAAIRTALAHLELAPVLLGLGDFEAREPAALDLPATGEEPFDGVMTLQAGLYAAAARRGLRVVLDGMPGDNLFAHGGFTERRSLRMDFRRAFAYAHAMEARTRGRWAASAVAGWRVAKPWLPHFLLDFRNRTQARAAFQRDMVEGSFIHPDFASRVRLWDRYQAYLVEMASNRSWDEAGMVLSCMASAYISAAAERYGRVATRFGVEPRHPFLDRRLVELLAWMPIDLRLRGSWEKWALRKAVEPALPASLVWRRDKSHLGFQFNQRKLSRWVLDGPDAWEGKPEFLGSILDLPRLRMAWQAWGREAGPGGGSERLLVSRAVAVFMLGKGGPPTAN